jgi:hypothetical protein
MSAKLCRRLTFLEFLAVRRALAAGARHVEIARELDLGIWTIERIAARLRYDDDPALAELPEDDAPPDYSAANLRRCPDCGAMVYVWPCLACRMATMERVTPAEEVEDEDGQERKAEIGKPMDGWPLTAKQRRWRRKQIVERVFGKAG